MAAASYNQTNGREMTCSSLSPIKIFINSPTFLWKKPMLLHIITRTYYKLCMSNTISAIWCICLDQILLQDQDYMKILQAIHLIIENYPKTTWTQSTFNVKQIALQLHQLDTEGVSDAPSNLSHLSPSNNA